MEQLVKIICYDKKVIIIDKERIKDRLEGAHAWLRFLEIEKSGFMASDKDANDCLTFCLEYQISSHEMLFLIIFLRTGLLPTEEYTLSKIIYISNTLGGIPELDKAYVTFIKDRERKKKEEYNPMTPVEDISDRFIWAAGDITSFQNDDWSVCANTGKLTTQYYFRKIKSVDDS